MIRKTAPASDDGDDDGDSFSMTSGMSSQSFITKMIKLESVTTPGVLSTAFSDPSTSSKSQSWSNSKSTIRHISTPSPTPVSEYSSNEALSDWDESFIGNIKQEKLDDRLDSSIKDSSSSTSVLQLRVCTICEETASGSHYGSWSCEGCKAFFKRSIQGNVKYECCGNSQCDLKGVNRKDCPSCRLEKCYASGMTTESIKGGKRSRMSVQKSMDLYRMQNKASGQLLNQLIEIEYPPLSADFSVPEAGNENTPSSFFFYSLITKLADRMVSFLVEWAKCVPGYSDLSMPSQRSLLQGSYFDHILIHVCYRSIPLAENNIQVATDLTMTKSVVVKLCKNKFTSGHEELFNTCNKFRELNVSFQEFVAIKSILLLFSDSDIDPIDSPYLVRLQDSVLDVLSYAVHETIHTRAPDTPDELIDRRKSNLLFLLRRLKRLSELVIDDLIEFNTSEFTGNGVSAQHADGPDDSGSFPVYELMHELLLGDAVGRR